MPAHQDLSNNTKGTFQFLPNLQLWFNLINFQWRNHSIFKNFCTTSPNIMEPSPCTPPCGELSNDTKNMIWSIPFRRISQLQNKTKQNKLPSFIDTSHDPLTKSFVALQRVFFIFSILWGRWTPHHLEEEFSQIWRQVGKNLPYSGKLRY